MKQKTGKRILCLALALEMLCAPLAIARSEDPAQVRPETPLGDEIPAVDAPVSAQEERPLPETDQPSAQDPADTPVDTPADAPADPPVDAPVQADLSALPEGEYSATMSFGIPLNSQNFPVRFNSYFAVETSESRSTWGYRSNGNGDIKMMVQKGDGYMYTTLPQVGRVPDLEFDGFYIVPELLAPWYDSTGWVDDTKLELVKAWTYDETWTGAVKLDRQAGMTATEAGLDPDMDSDADAEGSVVARVSQADLQALMDSGAVHRVETNVTAEDGTVFYKIPVVGRWVPSRRSQLTYLNLTTQAGSEAPQEVAQVYTEDPRGKTAPAALTLSGLNEDTEAREFWLRVPEETETLSLQFATYEPYYDYNVTNHGEGDSPVSISATFDGAPVSAALHRGWAEDSSDAAYPGPDSNFHAPTNSLDNPARAHWSVADIPLKKVSEAAGADAATTVTVAVTAPDGTAKSTYTLHVERLMTPTTALNYGNSPVGLIRRDTSAIWGTDPDTIQANKDAAVASFESVHALGDDGVTAPSGVTYKDYYEPRAWTGNGQANYNLDNDPAAVFAYQDMAFDDPGVTFRGSDGREVDFGAAAPDPYKTCVTRTIQLYTADQLTVDLLGADPSTTDGIKKCWYNPDVLGGPLTTDETQAAQTLHSAHGTDVVDLRRLKVLPGVYEMVYTYKDPLDPSAEDVTVRRPLVVLPIPGDVDMDGAVTAADALALKENQTAWESTSARQDLKLLRYRVYANASADAILAGFQPVLAELGHTDYFYTPLGSGVDYSRRAWDQVTMSGSTKLELKYLGLERGALMTQSGGTPLTDLAQYIYPEGSTNGQDGLFGPWNANGDGQVTIRPANAEANSYQPDIFWMGVYLTAGDLAGKPVEDMTLSLVYDSEYVRPMVVNTYNQFSGATDWEDKWRSALFYYNFGDGSKRDGVGQTIFSGKTGSDYDYKVGTDLARPYAIHYSKVVGDLETAQQDGGKLKEVVVTLQGKSGAPATLKDGCLLVLPFRLVKHPAASRLNGGSAQLIELSAGMRDFNLVTEPGAARLSSISRYVASLFAEENPRLRGGATTYAFSAQDDIYGGATQNLRQELGTVTNGLVPIGENKAQRTVLEKGTYAQPYRAAIHLSYGTVAGDLPDGLAYSSSQGTIEGTPIAAGTYDFGIVVSGTEYLYSITIDPITVPYWANSQSTYYGETEYRGVGSTDFTFRYDPDKIAQRDKDAAAANGLTTLTGDGAELAQTLTLDASYTPPTFTARESMDTTADPVAVKTPVRSQPYPIREETAPKAANYVFEYQEDASLTILKRPVWVDYVKADFFTAEDRNAQIYNDEPQVERYLTVTETSAAQPQVYLTLNTSSIVGGEFQNNTLTGQARVGDDLISLAFVGAFTREEKDIEHYPDQNVFYLTEGRESRPITNLHNLALMGACANNYNLVQDTPLHTDGKKDQVSGTVLRREITGITITSLPRVLQGETATYGTVISDHVDLRIKVDRAGQQIGDYDYTYSGADVKALDIHYNWVSPQDKAAGEAKPDSTVGSGWDPNALEGQQDKCPYNGDTVLTTAIDGYYLCVIARKFEGSDAADEGGADGGFIKVYSEDPIHVVPATLTLTPARIDRFYGEARGEVSYTYSFEKLSIPDQQKVRNWVAQELQEGREVDVKSAKALEWLMEELDDAAFQAPTFYYRKTAALPPDPSHPETDPDRVDQYTGVSSTNYYVVMTGAKSTNYNFLYSRVDGERIDDPVCGTNYLNIYRRPIVVDAVKSEWGTAAGGYKDNFATIYADTRDLLLNKQVDEEEGETPFVADRDQVTFALPTYDPAQKTVTYYTTTGGETPVVVRDRSFAAGSQPVLEQDKDNLQVSYAVRFIPDVGHGAWNSFTDNYYSVDALTEEDGQGQRSVEVANLTLSGDPDTVKNYMLVYTDHDKAQRRAPDQAVLDSTHPGTDGAHPTQAYMIYGTGTVILRPIEEMELKSVGKMTYDYGETFSPSQLGNNKAHFTLEVRYDTRYDNAPGYNVTSERVDYVPLIAKGPDGGEYVTDSFTQRGFQTYYVGPEVSGTPTQAQLEAIVAAGKTLEEGDRLYPGVHSGARLFVVGKRGEKDLPVYSVVSTSRLKVNKGHITLTASDMHRFYGEDNTADYPYTYTFSAADLAPWDREALGKSEHDVVTQAELEAGVQADAAFGYQAPAITCAATAASGMNKTDATDWWGEYLVTLTPEDFSNYIVSWEPGTLYVYPRPIKVTGVTSDAANPIYTVYNESDVLKYETSFTTATVNVAPADLGGTVGKYTQVLRGGGSKALTLSNVALVGADAPRFTATVDYVDFASQGKIELSGGQTDETTPVAVAVSGLTNPNMAPARNYQIVEGLNDNYNATGAVKLRTIHHIHITGKPTVAYTYGEALDLSGLEVTIYYEQQTGEGTQESVSVRYASPEQFRGYGLYVNYFDLEKNTLPTAAADRKQLTQSLRKAGTGDHLTIAPTHDTQGTAEPFSANRKALVVSAFQAGGNQSAAAPKILGANQVTLDGVPCYEQTGSNDAARIVVNPLPVTYTLSATDKTYDGDKKTAGTLTLTNLFSRNTQTIITSSGVGGEQSAATERITDAVYVPVGAPYESGSANHADFATLTAQIAAGNGSVAFATGAYAPNGLPPLGDNGAVNWAQWDPSGRYAWGTGLTFSFANANVHYEDDRYESGRPGVGTPELAQYWRANQPHNAVTDGWDTYNRVSALPVEVTGMVLAGPDAANYTWSKDSVPQPQTQVTLDTDPATLGQGQANVPFATIHKANRKTIQELAPGSLPTLSVDRHSNAVKVLFDQGLLAETGGGWNNNNHATADDYQDELHFEYALYYDADGNGTYGQWAGASGRDSYQDTVFFGGETCRPPVPAGYKPNLDQLPSSSTAGENTVYRGQVYGWVLPDADGLADNGRSAAGFQANRGFYQDADAYPGIAEYGAEQILAAYWNYTLYNTDRTALPRNTVFYPLVRLSETHNYNASGDLTGDGDGDGSPDVSAAQLSAAQTDPANGSGAVFGASQAMKTAATAAADGEKAQMAQLAEGGRWPEEGLSATTAPAPAAKTYQQRFDLLSASRERNRDGGDAEYLVQFLESMWFTDVMEYADVRLLDAVVYNQPTRYYGYYWDVDKTAALELRADSPVDFGSKIEGIPVRVQQPGGATLETTMDYDPVATNFTAQLYVETTSNSGRTIRSIKIVPTALYARLGDEPYQLGVVTDPPKPTNRRYTWTSSDPSVATVDEKGLVTFRGVGTAVITVKTDNGRTNSITVVVSEVLPIPAADESLFNFFYSGAWETLDEGKAFRPKEGMTRADAVTLLALFLDPDSQWQATQELAYVDVTGREKYYEALRRLTGAGVVTGLPGGAFAGEQLATRAEFVTMVARMLRLDVPDTRGQIHAFADCDENQTWAYAYIDALAKTGVIRGVGGGDFAPSRVLTREESAAIIARLLTVRLHPDQPITQIPTDMTPENWSYPAVLRAVNAVLFPD